MKTSFICISVKNLAEVLGRDKPIREFISSGGLEQPNGHLKLAALIQERTANLAVIPEGVAIVARTKANADVLNTIKGTPRFYIDHLNRTLATLRVSILRHKVQAVSLVEEGGKSHGLLVSLWANISEAFDRMGPSRLGTDLTKFSESYLEAALTILRPRAAKFSISLMLDDDIRQGTMASLADLLELKSNPRPKVLKIMVAEFHRLTDRQTECVTQHPDLMLKFLKAQRMVEEQQGDIMVEAVTWVRAQCFYYHDHHGNERNIATETGYICGAESLRRYLEFKENLALPKGNEPPAQVRTVSRGKKFR